MKKSSVNKDVFLRRMRNKWRAYGLEANDALEEAWRIFVKTLNKHATDKNVTGWSVFPLPTGTGKTEGLKTYCSIVSETLPNQGVLIITRFTDEANKIAQGINDEAGTVVAKANHSKLNKEDKLSAEEQKNVQILVITHAAYKKSLSGKLENTDYSSWVSGQRLIVIDETLNVDEPLTVDLDELRIARASIPYEIEKQFYREAKFLDVLIDRFVELTNNDRGIEYIDKGTWARFPTKRVTIHHKDIEPLIQSIQKLKPVRAVSSFGKEVIKLNPSYIVTIFRTLVEITQLDGFYFQDGEKYKVQAINLIMPSEVPSAVILDATAEHNEVYNLLGRSVEILQLPHGIRDYTNVSLNIVYGVNTGKDSVSKLGAKDIRKLYDSYGSKLPLSNTLFCVHKKNREILKKAINGLPKIEKTNLAHWGNIDGKNDWSELNNIFMLGLPYLGQKNAEGIELAFRRWIEATNYKYHPDLEIECEHTGAVGHEEMPLDLWKDVQQSHINISVIQAINRIRCRKPIDSNGRCASTRITLFLDKKNSKQEKIQSALLDSISDAMPNIAITENTEIEANNMEDKLTEEMQAFYDLLTSLERGEHSAKDIMAKAQKQGIGERTVKRYQSDLKKAENAETLLSQMLLREGISYVSGSGRYANALYIAE